MATWNDFAAEAPELSTLAERRLTATGLVLLATLRADGYPRISPVEPLVDGDRLVLFEGHMPLGMMLGSTKARDLRRDPRCALHSATADKEVSEGDVKFWARAVELTDEADLERLANTQQTLTGWRPDPGTFHMFLPVLAGASSVRVVGDAMLVDTWKPGEGVVTVEKHN